MKDFEKLSQGVGLVCLMAALCFAGPVWAEEGSDEASEEELADGEEQDEEEAEPARPTPKLFVLPVDSVRGELSEIVTERINSSTRERLESLSGVDFLPTFEEIHGSGERTPAALIAEAEQQYTSGIGLVNAGHYQRAMEALHPAVETLEANIADLHNFGILTDALANLAIAYYEAGYDLDARQAIQKYAQLNPDASLDRDSYPEQLVELFESELERIETAGTGIVHIESDHEGAQVYLNGEILGETPLTTEEIGFGEHYLVVRRGDWRWAGKIRVRARGQEQTETVELVHREEQEDELAGMPSYYVDLRETIQSGRFGEELEPYLQEMANQTGADFVAWSLAQRDGRNYALTPFIYRVEDSLLVQGEDVLFNQELSNVRSRSNELSDIYAASVIFMPENRAVEYVDLVGEEEVVAVEEPEEDPDVDEVSVDEERDVVAAADERPTEELPVPRPGDSPGASEPFPDEPGADRSDMMRYLGWGGAAALGTGIIVTTIVLIARSSGDGVGFEAEVQW